MEGGSLPARGPEAHVDEPRGDMPHEHAPPGLVGGEPALVCVDKLPIDRRKEVVLVPPLGFHDGQEVLPAGAAHELRAQRGASGQSNCPLPHLAVEHSPVTIAGEGEAASVPLPVHGRLSRKEFRLRRAGGLVSLAHLPHLGRVAPLLGLRVRLLEVAHRERHREDLVQEALDAVPSTTPW